MMPKFALALCTLAIATPAAAQVKPRPSAANLMAQVPMQLGYYVSDGETCAKPSSATKFGPASVTDIGADGAHLTRLASVKRSEGGYWLQFAGKFDEQDPQGIQLKPKGPGRIEVTIQDTATMHYCAAAELPAAFRK